MATLITSLRDVNPKEWETPADFEQSVHRLGTGGNWTNESERKLKVLVDVLQEIRDMAINDAVAVASKDAIDATQLSNSVAVNEYISAAFRARPEQATLAAICARELGDGGGQLIVREKSPVRGSADVNAAFDAAFDN